MLASSRRLSSLPLFIFLFLVLNCNTAYTASTFTPGPDSIVSLTWLGVSSWIITRGRDVVIIDPFFSRPGKLSVFLNRKISYDKGRIQKVLPDLPVEGFETRLLLVGHAHYDHLMDVPYYLLESSSHMPKPTGHYYRYVASATAYNLLAGFYGAQNFPAFKDANNSTGQGVVFDIADHSLGRPISVGRIRITPFGVDHAGLAREFSLGLHYAEGEVISPFSSPPVYPGDYREGQTLAFFIDFLDAIEPRIVFRVFVTSAALSPRFVKRIPKMFLNWDSASNATRDHYVDVAILCVPGWNYVEAYPKELLEDLKPENVILSHFDDFFSEYVAGLDPQRDKAMFVLNADYDDFVAGLKELSSQYQFKLHQPATGSTYACALRKDLPDRCVRTE